MCGRIVWIWDPATGALVAKFDHGLTGDPELQRLLERSRYNVPPTSTLPFIVGDGGETRVEAARWGFPLPGRPTGVFNTRVETVDSSPMWNRLFGANHCILPVRGFYEWGRTGAGRTPYFIHRVDGEPMILAGVWGRVDVSGSQTVCASIVTCEPNALVAQVHDRMPVVLEPDVAEEWLHPDTQDDERLRALAGPAGDVLTMHEVSTDVNDVANDGPHLIEPTGQQRLF